MTTFLTLVGIAFLNLVAIVLAAATGAVLESKGMGKGAGVFMLIICFLITLISHGL